MEPERVTAPSTKYFARVKILSAQFQGCFQMVSLENILGSSFLSKSGLYSMCSLALWQAASKGRPGDCGLDRAVRPRDQRVLYIAHLLQVHSIRPYCCWRGVQLSV